MIRKIVLATNNQGKVHEFSDMFSQVAIEFIPQSEFNLTDADETGTTFVENAIIKARHAACATNMPAVADDSGIAVDYLDGRPGVYSARFAGVHGDAAANNEKLLEMMKDVPEAKRKARFHCVLVYMRHGDDPAPLICQGVWEGIVTTALKGEQGFGYDPLFYVPTHNCSAAELDIAVKNQISHRARAVKLLLSYFK